METKTTIVIDKNTPPFDMLTPSGAIIGAQNKKAAVPKKEKQD